MTESIFLRGFQKVTIIAPCKTKTSCIVYNLAPLSNSMRKSVVEFCILSFVLKNKKNGKDEKNMEH